MRHATGWGLAVVGLFAVGSGIAIDCNMYTTAIFAAFSAMAVAYVGPEAWK